MTNLLSPVTSQMLTGNRTLKSCMRESASRAQEESCRSNVHDIYGKDYGKLLAVKGVSGADSPDLAYIRSIHSVQG